MLKQASKQAVDYSLARRDAHCAKSLALESANQSVRPTKVTNMTAAAPHKNTDIENGPGAGEMRVLVCGGRAFGGGGVMISALGRVGTAKVFTGLGPAQARSRRTEA